VREELPAPPLAQLDELATELLHIRGDLADDLLVAHGLRREQVEDVHVLELGDACLAKLEAAAHEEDICAGEWLVHEGQDVDRFCVLVEGMVEWVTAHVLRYHLGTDAHVLGQDGVWRNDVTAPLAAERTVAILGLGELGRAVAAALLGLGFDVRGWSRREKELPGMRSLSGDDGLAEVLREADIVVTLLPATPETERLIDARRLAMLPRGARLINPGRGELIDDAALVGALDSGHLAHATLDVFREEPLPAWHPFWAHPRITVTPHVAAETRPETAAEAIARNVRRGEDGEPLLFVVDRAAGY
jgi:glyoxylate/hydroxypyruvate reductase A